MAILYNSIFAKSSPVKNVDTIISKIFLFCTGQKVTLVSSPGHPDQVSIFSSHPSTTQPLSRAHTITESLNLRVRPLWGHLLLRGGGSLGL